MNININIFLQWQFVTALFDGKNQDVKRKGNDCMINDELFARPCTGSNGVFFAIFRLLL